MIERMYNRAQRSVRAAGAPRPPPTRRPSPGRRPLTWTALRRWRSRTCRRRSARRLVEEHLLDERRFWLPVAPPSVPPTEPSFSLAKMGSCGSGRYWRGPTWINAAWLVWLGLRRLGYLEHADTLAERISAAVLASGLREYYHPYTGRGMGAVDFAWSSLVMELLAADPAAATGSYLRV